jgi:mannose-6-phosphate isomerase-like protein (cupin superfamily)
MLSPTLREGLKAYAIGPKIRSIRLKKKMGLVELGSTRDCRQGCSRRSNVDSCFRRCRRCCESRWCSVSASTTSLRRTATSRWSAAIRIDCGSGEGRRQGSGVRVRVARLSRVQRLLNSYFVEFFAVAAEKLRRHQHPGAEFIYVLPGTLTLHIGAEQHTLEAPDSIYFDSTVPHAYRKSGAKACCALVVTTG